ncbi:sialate O-acetylesterase [Soonwooa sp.]|uniref:sialate O-acetylesterase n=1 Tax=Soonwooa sp. TaxID=1938592 RepID=UPI00260C6576|nr:sialate O-acetylesterase [Soonwooa sp.]
MTRNFVFGILLVILFFSGLSTSILAKVKLPILVGDGMVLQRNQKIKIWGTADASEKIKVNFLKHNYTTTADQNGNWYLYLPSMKAGGPYKMQINDIVLNDILIGDVWLASGQSNMELPMYRLRTICGDEIKHANNPNIRFFTVPQKYNFKSPQASLDGGVWESTTSKTINNFSAVAYFFAKDLNAKYNIPIGIINASLGGSPIQAWMDVESLKNYPNYVAEAQKWNNDDLIKSTEANDKSLSDAWYAELNQSDIGVNQNWVDNSVNYADWKTIVMPDSWENQEGAFDGSVWLKKEIILPKSAEGKSAFLNLGRIKDADETYINGVKVGNITYEYPPRWYSIPESILKEGKNIITVRVINGSGKGEFVADKPYYLEVDGQRFDLTGKWFYKIGAKMKQMAPGQTFVRWKSTGLYNAMINPLISFGIKGALWYQGESNTAKPTEYQDLLTTLISDWRSKFQQKNMPFLVVQLANFMEPKKEALESNWAELRNQQRKVAQEVPNVGLAVAIDLGEWNDIHPLDKKSVGQRLALQAEKLAYSSNITADGPIYQSVKFEGNQAIISFKNDTNDFEKVDVLKGFSIKNKEGKWYWANAKILGKTIVVSSDNVPDPVAVRYAWADNPDTANLRNNKGLPASPFTTEK